MTEREKLIEQYQSLVNLCNHKDATVGGIKLVIECRIAALTPKTTIQEVVKGTPAGQEAVQRAMERSAEVIETKTTEQKEDVQV